MDLIGPLLISKGHTHYMTVMDRFTRWLVVFPVKDISAECYILLFRITTDQGKQFVSNLFNSLARAFRMEDCHTSAYYPQAWDCRRPAWAAKSSYQLLVGDSCCSIAGNLHHD
ncbi:hypothetical protein KM043_014466 [Ampulex compressa]|nr:hypothetical protein KM043_014466 [Ampulex compressa]